ncbi:hypothetical protein A2892_05315 [Candidatus Woesebacteria bacterium RIFCSPLOWO2_01_FULL_39_10b]|uniref:Uncharacterized protein n=1 Tax=Candidatus Woesebacteria bacterium RIFCSPLOWO2_01_FULL_39_10b TaxID=1802517 RepID=A0A1F8BA90_9BACT|nr:MAG: hypothetical protein A2892_05315 [Candidatus Woesebacteria bacterium RIFCSPLOWO2_01_FULL_39_10b]
MIEIFRRERKVGVVVHLPRFPGVGRMRKRMEELESLIKAEIIEQPACRRDGRNVRVKNLSETRFGVSPGGPNEQEREG